MTIQSQYPIEVTCKVRGLFSNPGRSQGSAFLRREVAERMREKLALVKLEASTVLDAGCGTAEDLSHLRQRFPQAAVYGLDAAEPMLSLAQGQASAAKTGIERLLRQILPTDWRGASNKDLVCGA